MPSECLALRRHLEQRGGTADLVVVQGALQAVKDSEEADGEWCASYLRANAARLLQHSLQCGEAREALLALRVAREVLEALGGDPRSLWPLVEGRVSDVVATSMLRHVSDAFATSRLPKDVAIVASAVLRFTREMSGVVGGLHSADWVAPPIARRAGQALLQVARTGISWRTTSPRGLEVAQTNLLACVDALEALPRPELGALRADIRAAVAARQPRDPDADDELVPLCAENFGDAKLARKFATGQIDAGEYADLLRRGSRAA